MRFPSIAFISIVTSSMSAHALPITVDPAGPAFTGTFAVEWNTAANFESWTTTQVNGAAVTGGLLSGTTSGGDPQVIRSNFAGGPDLDLGFNDFIETRLQVPASFAGDIQIFYGTTARTGFNAARVITIPNATIPKDGAFHVYRIDVGPEPWWRATLRDLRVDPGSVSGVAFAIDYLRVGDLPGDVYLPNTTDQPVTAYELASKHFRFIWDANRAANNGINATIARGCLRNAEEAWQTYVKLLGYREPAESTDPVRRDGNKYKVNFLCTFDGFWMGGSPTSFGYLNIEPGGLQVDPPTWVIPHELMHVFQMHNTSGHVPGEWWETHANYARERWLYHYANLYQNTSNLEAQAVRDSHLMMSSGRNYYLTWLPFLYVDENPDALPDLHDGMVAKVWQETRADEFSMMALDRLTPTTSLKDIIGYYARRGATYDYAQQAAINATLNGQDSTRNARHVLTDLVRRADDPTWWRVPMGKAPAQGAYVIHQLVPAGTGAGRLVTVNLHGLSDTARGADWRASLIAVSDTGVERYTPLWNAGSSSITLAANENTLYLSVAGTPDVFHYGGHDESLHPFRSHPSRSRFHYEVQVTGATPRERNNGLTAGLIQHANGGGYKASTASVAATAYLAPNARVLGNAVVGNTARIEDYAVVQDSAQVLNNAIVSGHAWVRGNAIVRDFARVRDWAIVDGGTISGNGRVLEHATANCDLTDSAVAKGSAISSGGTLSGNAVVDGDYSFNKSLSNGVTFGHLPYVGIPDNFTRATPAGLYAAYDFATAHDSRVLDQNGVTDGYVIGSPTWTAADAKRSGFLNFNGANQYVVLDRSVADTRAFTFTAWVKPLGGAANQAVLWLGATPTKRMTFTPDDGTGHAKFSIANGGADQTLTASSALPTGVWSHVAVTLDGSTGKLYVNGTAAATGAISIVPDQLLAANTTTAAQHNYLARSEASAMPMFRGALDDVKFHTRALTASDITAMQPFVFPSYTPAVAGTLYVDLRASDFSAGTWPNPGTLGDFTALGGPAKIAGVSGTPFDGVQFDGDDAFQGPNSVADLHGSSDRSIEVWVFNPSFSDEETTVSWGHRGSSRRNMAFNFGSNGSYGVGAATHWDDDVAWTSTPSAGAWHHAVYTYTASTVTVYLDGAVAVTKTLAGALNTFAGESINIGSQRESANGARSFHFAGYLNTVRIHGGVLTPAQVSANFALGPSGPPPNTAPQLNAIPDQTLDSGASATIPITVGDTDTALAAVTISVSAANATLVPAANISVSGTGASRSVHVTPASGLTGSTTITLLASDGVATATRTFTLTALTRLETWRRQAFGTHDNSGAAADLFDSNGDGEVNLIEFATGQLPNAATTVSTPLMRNGATLDFTYTRSRAAMADGMSFFVEWSDTFSGWSAVGVSEQLISDNGTVQIVKATVPAGHTAKRFIHLKVSNS